MSKTRRYTKKKKHNKKRTRKYGYSYKKRKTYKKRKQQKGGVKCLMVNSSKASTSTSTSSTSTTYDPSKINKYIKPSSYDGYTYPNVSEIKGGGGTRPKDLTSEEIPNILVFWYDDNYKDQRNAFVTYITKEAKYKGKKEGHWIWWVYPNIKTHDDDKGHLELFTDEEYNLLWANKDYRTVRIELDTISFDKKEDDMNVKFKDWFSPADAGRLDGFERLHMGEMLKGFIWIAESMQTTNKLIGKLYEIYNEIKKDNITEKSLEKYKDMSDIYFDNNNIRKKLCDHLMIIFIIPIMIDLIKGIESNEKIGKIHQYITKLQEKNLKTTQIYTFNIFRIILYTINKLLILLKTSNSSNNYLYIVSIFRNYDSTINDNYNYKYKEDTLTNDNFKDYKTKLEEQMNKYNLPLILS